MRGNPIFFGGLRVVLSGRNEDFSEELLFDIIFCEKNMKMWNLIKEREKR